MSDSDNESDRVPLTVLCRKTVATGKKVYQFFSFRPVKYAIRILVTLLFVSLVNKGIRKNDIVRLINDVELIPCIAAFFCGATSILLQVLRWHMVLKIHQFSCSFRTSIQTMFKGFFLAFITPGRVGELFRAVDLEGKRKTETLFAVIEERFFGIITTVVIGLIAMAIGVLAFNNKPFFPLQFLSIFFLGVVIVSGVYIRRLHSVPQFLRRFPHVVSWLKQCAARLKGYPYKKLVAVSVGAQLFLIVETALLLTMFGADGFIRNIVVAAQAYSFMLLLPIFIANIGIREYSFSFFLIRMADTPFSGSIFSCIAIGGATCILFFNTLIPAAIGLVWLFTGRNTTPTLDC